MEGLGVLEEMGELTRRGEAFALATVVWRQGPSSSQSGSRAIITAEGELHGWIGGACAEPVVIREAQRVMAEGTAKLLLLGTPGWMLRPWILSRPIKPVARLLTQPLIAFLIFSAVFVTAHFPPIFDRMCRDENFHIFLHLLFMASGVILWWPILSPLPELPRLSYPAQILYLFILMIPMTAVAAPITLATSVIYPWYTEGAHGWGLKPIDDQVLGGLMMWIGQATYLMAVFTAIFYQWSRRDDRDEPPIAAASSARAKLRAIQPAP